MKSYIHFDYVRKIKDNAKRNSGGISVFIKSGFCKKLSFQRLYEHFDNTVVLLCKLSTICQSEDVIMYLLTYHLRDLVITTIKMTEMGLM